MSQITSLLIVLAVGAAAIAALFLPAARHSARHRRLREPPFPEEWQDILRGR